MVLIAATTSVAVILFITVIVVVEAIIITCIHRSRKTNDDCCCHNVTLETEHNLGGHEVNPASTDYGMESAPDNNRHEYDYISEIAENNEQNGSQITPDEDGCEHNSDQIARSSSLADATDGTHRSHECIDESMLIFDISQECHIYDKLTKQASRGITDVTQASPFGDITQSTHEIYEAVPYVNITQILDYAERIQDTYEWAPNVDIATLCKTNA